MPYLKPIKGHTSCKSVKRYLEKNGRALATDYIGIVERDELGRDWAEQMDYSRALLGTDIPHKSKKVRTYNHYVMSPDPRDALTLEQLREFTMDYLDRAFEGKFEIAVVYHDDNENGVIHAHFVVNNPNLEEGGRLSSWLTNARVKEIQKCCQDLAAEYGYHNFLDRPDEDAARIAADELGILEVEDIPKTGFHGISGKKRSRSFVTNQEYFYTRTEREILLSGGYSWKEDIRARVKIARELSTTEKGFLQVMEALDVDCQMTARGDYQFSLVDTPKKKVVGYKLGRAFSRTGIRMRLANEDTRKILKPDTYEAARLMAAFDDFRIVGINTIGYLEPRSNLSLNDVARSLETINAHNIRKRADYDRALAACTTREEFSAIQDAQSVMEQIGRFGTPAAIRKGAPNAFRPETPIETLTPEEAARIINKARSEKLEPSSAKAAKKRTSAQRKRSADGVRKQAQQPPAEEKRDQEGREK